MTLLNTKSKKIIIVIIIALSVGLILGTISTSCSLRHIDILNEIKKFEQTLDPEFCENLVYKIDVFNDECEPEIEIVDCG